MVVGLLEPGPSSMVPPAVVLPPPPVRLVFLVGIAIHHCPLCCAIPTMASPLKLPTWTSTQFTEVLQVSQSELEKPAPELVAVHH